MTVLKTVNGVDLYVKESLPYPTVRLKGEKLELLSIEISPNQEKSRSLPYPRMGPLSLSFVLTLRNKVTKAIPDALQ